jgi:hypothetical protein
MDRSFAGRLHGKGYVTPALLESANGISRKGIIGTQWDGGIGLFFVSVVDFV